MIYVFCLLFFCPHLHSRPWVGGWWVMTWLSACPPPPGLETKPGQAAAGGRGLKGGGGESGGGRGEGRGPGAEADGGQRTSLSRELIFLSGIEIFCFFSTASLFVVYDLHFFGGKWGFERTPIEYVFLAQQEPKSNYE